MAALEHIDANPTKVPNFRYGRFSDIGFTGPRVRYWLCVTSIAGPHGGAQLYER